MEKEAHLTQRLSVGLASNLNGSIFAFDEKGNKVIFYFSLTGWFSQVQSHIP